MGENRSTGCWKWLPLAVLAFLVFSSPAARPATARATDPPEAAHRGQKGATRWGPRHPTRAVPAATLPPLASPTSPNLAAPLPTASPQVPHRHAPDSYWTLVLVALSCVPSFALGCLAGWWLQHRATEEIIVRSSSVNIGAERERPLGARLPRVFSSFTGHCSFEADQDLAPVFHRDRQIPPTKPIDLARLED